MAALQASKRFWSLSRNTLVAAALGCGSLMALALPGATAIAQDAVAQPARTDAQMQADVQKQVTTAPGLNGQKISATTTDGVVTLTGSVTDEVTRQIAENAASGVAGVKSVKNNLTVGDDAGAAQPNEAAAAAATGQPPAQQGPAQQGAAQQGQQGANGGWGPAGPPPDAVNGQVPPRPQQGAAANGAPDQGAPAAQKPPAGTSYGPPMGGAQNGGYPQPGAYPNQGAYPSQGGYPGGQGGYGQGAYGQGSYGQAPARQPYPSSGQMQAPRYLQPAGPVTLPAGTLLTVRLQNPIDARRIQAGDTFVVNAARDVFQDGALAVPLGATLEGHVVAVKKPGAFSGGGDIQVELYQLDLDGHQYAVATDLFSTQTPGKGGYSAANTIGGTAFGAILGAVVGGGPGAAIGAVAGGATGAAISTATPAPRSFIPAETMITFHLKSAVTLQPVSPQEATRLAASMPRPVLRPRVVYAPPPGYYGYPGPYYR